MPGGRREPIDASNVETALREMDEEVGLVAENIEVIGKIGAFRTLGNVLIHSFLGVSSTEPTDFFLKSEISRVLEVPLSILLEQHQEYLGKVPSIEELIYPVEGNKIWGATARIMYTFLEAVFQCFQTDS